MSEEQVESKGPDMTNPGNSDLGEVVADNDNASLGDLSGTESLAEAESNDLILGKFKTHEDLAKAYEELEKKIGSSEPEVTTETAEEAATEEPKAETVAEQVIPGLSAEDYSTMQDEYISNNGELTEETYATLAKAGYNKAIVDSYLEGEKARTERLLTDVGGQDKFNTMAEWAKTNMDKEMVDKVNSLLASNDQTDVKLGLSTLKNSYESANGKTPSLLKAQQSSTPTDVYKSNAEVIRAMQHPQYSATSMDYDPAYAKEVQAKLIRSKKAGTI